VQAQALFAAARVAEQKQDYPRALRLFQRAWRLDGEATLALREIVPLAFNLERQAEAVRYAVILGERDPADPVMLRRLALYLTEEGDVERALGLFEKALALETAGKPAASTLPLRMEMGRLLFVEKNYEAAAKHFAEIAKALDDPKLSGLDEATQRALVGKPQTTYQLFGECFLGANRPDEALAAFEKAHKAKADKGLYAYNLARVAAKKKQPAQALAKLQLFFDEHISNQGTEPYKLLGELLGQLGQEDQLIDRLKKLHADDPENVPLAYSLAQRHLAADKLDEAESVYAKLIEVHKSRPPLEAFQGLIEIARKQKNTEKMLRVLGEAVGRTGSLTALGDSAKAVLADTELAKGVVASAQKSPQTGTAAYGQRLAAALVAIELKDFAGASANFEAALKADPDKAGEVFVTWGLESFAAGQYADAIAAFQRGLTDKALPDKESRLHYYLAGALEMNGQSDLAIQSARKAAALEHDAPRFASRVAWIQYHAKRYDDARASYSALIEIHDKKYDSPEVREVMRDARLALSNLSVTQNNLPEGEEFIEQVLDEYPEDTSAQNDLGYLWADAGKHLERARQMIQAAVAAEPKNMAYRDSLGWVLFRLGRHDEAIAELKVAASGEDPDGVILDHLADVLLKKGDIAGAVEQWTRAVTYFDKHSDADKAKQARDKISAAQSTPAKD
jgi:tetratricopeptide (TPR) repeat protein